MRFRAREKGECRYVVWQSAENLPSSALSQKLSALLRTSYLLACRAKVHLVHLKSKSCYVIMEFRGTEEQ